MARTTTAGKALLALIVCVSLSVGLSAASYDYVIDRYDVDVQVGMNGVYTIHETLYVDFNAPRHGIIREIPVGYGANQVQVSDIHVSDPAQVQRSRQYVSLQIGDADRTVVGTKRYDIQYRYDPGDDGHYDYDEFYLNLVGEGWQVPIETFSFQVSFPQRIDTDYVFLTRGVWGSEGSRDAWNAVSDDLLTVTGGATDLMPGEALTLRVQLPDGYFVGTRQIHDWTAVACAVFMIGTALSVAAAFFLWLRWGRDDEPIIMARYEAPDGLTPMDVGYLSDGVVDDKDVTAMIFYWADKGCLTIGETGRKKSYVFTRVKEPAGATAHEAQLFEKFFSCGNDGVVTMDDLEGSFGRHIEGTKRNVASYYTGERALTDRKSSGVSLVCGALAVIPALGYAVAMTVNYMDVLTLLLLVCGAVAMFVGATFSWSLMRKWYLRSRAANIALIIVFGVLMIVEYVVLVVASLLFNSEISPAWVFGCAGIQVFSISAIMFLSQITHKRSAYGQEMLEQVLGLREFIDKVEMDRLRMMIDHDPMVFYHVLSYAIVLGLEDTWAKKFSSITMKPPTWYAGGSLVWDAMFYSALARRWNNSFSTARGAAMGHSTSPRNPGMRFGGSSFGSSGFSGGGFGGGGGRAW
jgi:uncharacterized membrane protein YgcG